MEERFEQDSKYYEVPVYMLAAIKRKEWGVVRTFAQQKWNEDGYALLMKYRKAVNRVIQVFIQEKSYPDNYADRISEDQKKKIAFYIHNLGMAAVIDDIRHACNENPQIRSINYFLVAEDGKRTGRWGMLYFAMINNNWDKIRKEELNCHIGESLEIGQKVKEQWQINAEKRIAELEKIKLLPPQEQNELYALKRQVERWGVHTKDVEIINE